ncbi:single-stranded DNA-binding protein [bacterium]|nr:single-stranded DNA-binding protein [candidate division CSSED10-310 bacterium]
MINSVCLVGNLAADPEIRSTPGGKKVAKMRMAVNDYWTNRQTGERNERTHWFTLNAWDRMADTCERLLTKGIKIAVRGSLEYLEWTSGDGTKRSRIEVRVREMEILTPKGQTTRESAGTRQYADPEPARSNKPVEDHGSYNDSSEMDDFPPVADDDIPF